MSLSCGGVARVPFGRALAAVALALVGGCSDDGLSPTAGGTGADAGSGGSTGSVSTTVTASAGEAGPTGGGLDDDGNDDDADDGGTAGLSDTGGEDGTSADDDGSGGVAESTSDGGASTGDSGSTGDTDTGGPAPGMACVSDADCVVVDDCCACTAAHEDDDVAACPENCEAPQCTAAGLSDIGAECVFGHCQLQKVPCNGAFLQCDQTPPECPDGMLPSVDENASCWTGDCVPAEACDVVPSCSFCEDGQACVQTSTQIAPLYGCWPVDPSCDGTPSCACMGEVCTDPFICGDGGAGDVDLGCSCPVCG